MNLMTVLFLLISLMQCGKVQENQKYPMKTLHCPADTVNTYYCFLSVE